MPSGVRRGTRKGTRALGTFKQAVLVLRWFLDDTHIPPACDSVIQRHKIVPHFVRGLSSSVRAYVVLC